MTVDQALTSNITNKKKKELTKSTTNPFHAGQTH